MFRRNAIPLLYCVFFPVLIGIVLLVIPEFSSWVSDKPNLFVRFVRILIAIWLILAYVSIGISFIPNLESSPIALFNTWGKYYRFLDNNHEPRVDRSIFHVYYFLPALIVSAFASFVFLLAVSTFIEATTSSILIIMAVNFLLLFLPQTVLYSKVVRVVYGNE